MSRQPILLDLYCGAGGAGHGYALAGFQVIGVDLYPQPRYPYEFIQSDAIEYLRHHWARFDVIHASPPCKVHTTLKAFSAPHHLNMVTPTRSVLATIDRPWVMENVPGAPLIDPVTLCGSSFGLGVRRHRLFESNRPLTAPPCDHRGQAATSPGYPVKRYHSGRPVITMSPVIGVFGRGQGLGPGEVDLWKRAMGIDWMSRDEMREAIPPAYSAHIGRQLLQMIT